MVTPDRGATGRPPPSLFQSLRGYLGTWVELLRTRVELFSTEWQEERERLEQIVILAAASLLCLTFGVLMVTLFVVVAFWDTNYRLAVLGGFAVLYLAAGTVVGVITRRKSRSKPKLFSATLGELAKDYRHLSS
jgi:uncharacterized membrane protein YqjE